jgi:putative acetyltransferase
MAITIIRTNSEDHDFIALVKFLDTELAQRDGNEHSFYAQYNKIDTLQCVVLAYENEEPAGCGAIKEYSTGTMEIKRMFTMSECREKGIASRVLTELEKWATELNYKKLILETGKRQPEAIALYKKNGYKIIPNYGQYENVENSICFEKETP